MRASGILMPVFSLPGPFGIGTLGKEAFAFVDFLAEAKQSFWQILPIGPTGYGDSPYQSFSAFAGNPYFIDYRLLASDGWLTADEIPAERPVGPIDYGARTPLLAGGLGPVHGSEGRAGAGGPCRLAERAALP